MRIARWIGIAVLLVVLAVAALPFLIDANQFRPMLENELTKALARPVTVGDLRLSIFSGGVTAGDLSIADDPAYSRTPFLHTRSVTLGVALWPLIAKRQLHITQLTLDQPQIDLLQSASGEWNFSTLGGKPSVPRGPHKGPAGPGFDLSVKLVKISNGRMTFAQHDSNAKSRQLENVDVEVRDFSAASAFPFSLSAKLAGGTGTLQLSGTAGPIDAADAAQTPATVKVKLYGFDLAAAGVESSAGLSGLVALDGAGRSNGRTLFLNGRLKVDQLKMAKNGVPAKESVAFDFTLEHDLRKRAGILRRGEIHVGSAPSSLTGTYAAQGESTVVNLNLSGPNMPVPQLAAMLPPFGVELPAGSSLQGGTARAQLNFSGRIELLVLDGSLGLSNTRLAGFDLGSKMSTLERLAGIKTGPDTEIQTLSATVHKGPEGTAVQDIQFVAPALGTLAGAGTVSPEQALNFKMRATLHAGGVALAMIGAKSDAGVPFTILGTASHPVFRPDMKGLVEGRVESLEKNDLGKAAASILGGLRGKKKN